jgi:hypothetical protein
MNNIFLLLTLMCQERSKVKVILHMPRFITFHFTLWFRFRNVHARHFALIGLVKKYNSKIFLPKVSGSKDIAIRCFQF